MTTDAPKARHRTTYFYHSGVGDFHYGAKHPMKPHRMTLTHELVLAYGLDSMCDVVQPRPSTAAALAQFHTEDYVQFLRRIAPGASFENERQLRRHNMCDDCPVFDGVFDFCALYTGGSIEGAQRLCAGQADIAINWSGGLHHARKDEASGFCYVNDIVLAIMELLKHHARVLYIDIDIHHGDAVQEAFYLTDRVCTVSLHKFGHEFFPGTGDVKELGLRAGRQFSVNVPIDTGIEDEEYLALFKPIIRSVIDRYRPGAVVLQCGADSLASDFLGVFNLSIKAHGECVKYVKSFGLPTLVLGGGGYTICNVARCWAYETGLLVGGGGATENGPPGCEELVSKDGAELTNDIPFNAYFEYFEPDFQLHPPDVRKYDNLNTKESLNALRTKVLQNIKEMELAPSVQMHEVPPDISFVEFAQDSDEEEIA